LPVLRYAAPILVYFFFQAEDGIRDATVTGVQTCALPIYDLLLRTLGACPGIGMAPLLPRRTGPRHLLDPSRGRGKVASCRRGPRSEERRVGTRRSRPPSSGACTRKRKSVE